MNIKSIFKELYGKTHNESGAERRSPDVDWDNIVFYTENEAESALNAVVFFKTKSDSGWNRADLLIDKTGHRFEAKMTRVIQ